MNVGVSRLRHKVPPGHNSPLRRSVGASPDTLWVFRARHQTGKTETKMVEVEMKTGKTETKMPEVETKTGKTETKIQRRVAHATKFLRDMGIFLPQTGGLLGFGVVEGKNQQGDERGVARRGTRGEA